MRLIDKHIIGEYAAAMFDILTVNPSMEDTKNINETLKSLMKEWQKKYDFGRTPDELSEEFEEVAIPLGTLLDISDDYVERNSVLTLDDDKFFRDMLLLIEIGKD